LPKKESTRLNDILGSARDFKILYCGIMKVSQVNIAISIYSEFLVDGVTGLEYWRDCTGTLHFTAVHFGTLLEASVYMEEEAYFTFQSYVGDDEEEEDEEEEED